jgi:hypothetical protein
MQGKNLFSPLPGFLIMSTGDDDRTTGFGKRHGNTPSEITVAA